MKEDMTGDAPQTDCLRGFYLDPLQVSLGEKMNSTYTSGIGELANFVMGGSFVFTAGLIYRFHKSRPMAWLSCVVGSIVMGIIAVLTNYFILLPMFEQFMPLDQLIASFGALIPFIKTNLDVVLNNAFPFNPLKGIVISVFTMMIYKKLTPVLKGKY